MQHSNFKIGDAVIRHWNNRLYYICHDIDTEKWEFMIDQTKGQKFSKCKVSECFSNLRPATEQEQKQGYAKEF
jgi:ABC-type bacteriocin/lantibiotic exporter with double-glycine peptidase domain